MILPRYDLLLTREGLFDCLNAIYIYLDVELLSEMINLQTQLITIWTSNIELILKEPSETKFMSPLSCLIYSFMTSRKTVIHNMMPIFLVKSLSSTPSDDQEEYLDLLVDSRNSFKLTKWKVLVLLMTKYFGDSAVLMTKSKKGFL